LFLTGAIVTGATFFSMAWTGQHVLRELRVDVFEQLHASRSATTPSTKPAT
jgi:ATP-binding cassette, subfamily B, multidrug efflux pump